MPVGAGWSEDAPQVVALIDANLRDQVVPALVASAAVRMPFDRELPQHWHRIMLDGVVGVDGACPPLAAGRYRHPSWLAGNVAVGPFMGVDSAGVDAELAALERHLGGRFEQLDAAVPVGQPPSTNALNHHAFDLAATLHGEWVRIHPFLDGNGRTARLLGNWTLIRYGLPPLLRPRPRPDWGAGHHAPPGRYDYASMLSLASGDHRQMLAELKRLYRRAPPSV